MSMRQWWQVGQDRFTTREDAEDHARTAGEMFVMVSEQTRRPGAPSPPCSWDEVITAHAVSLRCARPGTMTRDRRDERDGTNEA